MNEPHALRSELAELELVAAAAAAHLQPLWDRYKTLVPRQPAGEPSQHWPWQTLKPLLDRASREVAMEHAERRVLMLTHPAFDGQAITTGNLLAAFQVLLPGETAVDHRHSAAALRFVAEGQGAETVVHGKSYRMAPGDLILTPNGYWHGHVNSGGERVIWLDALDLPLSKYLDAVFYQPGPAAETMTAPRGTDAFAAAGLAPVLHGSETLGRVPMLHYPWHDAVRAFERLPPAADGSRRLRYVNPLSGGPVMPTLDCYLWQPQPGRRTQAYRSTSNAVCYVVEGEGESTVGDLTLNWRARDVFTLPHWQWITHRAESTARLFLISDREVYRRLDLLREEDGEITP